MLWLWHRYFPVNFDKFLKTLLTTWGGCFFLSQNAKHQNTLSEQHTMGWLFAGKYSQWSNRFLTIREVYLESSQKCQQSNLQSLFSVKLCDNSKIVIVLYYHNRSTIQSDRLYNSNTSQVIQSDSSTHCKLVRFIPWDSLILPKKLWVFCCPFFYQ